MSQSEQSQEQKALLQWNRNGWYASTDKLDVFVPHDVYQRALTAYLASRGIERKTWLEIMTRCEEEWKRQCEAERAFQANLDQWFVSTEFGVFVRRK